MITPDQAIAIARTLKGVPADVRAGVGTNGTLYVVSFATGDEWDNLSVAVDARTGQARILDADTYSRLLPGLRRL